MKFITVWSQITLITTRFNELQIEISQNNNAQYTQWLNQLDQIDNYFVGKIAETYSRLLRSKLKRTMIAWIVCVRPAGLNLTAWYRRHSYFMHNHPECHCNESANKQQKKKIEISPHLKFTYCFNNWRCLKQLSNFHSTKSRLHFAQYKTTVGEPIHWTSNVLTNCVEIKVGYSKTIMFYFMLHYHYDWIVFKNVKMT